MQAQGVERLASYNVGHHLALAHAVHDRRSVRLRLEHETVPGTGVAAERCLGGLGSGNKASRQVCSRGLPRRVGMMYGFRHHYVWDFSFSRRLHVAKDQSNKSIDLS
jgi:hypothetical protein